jgi:hypothetical protein
VFQAEIATDIMFNSRPRLLAIWPDLVRHPALNMSSEDVLGFLGRKLHPSLAADVVRCSKKLLPLRVGKLQIDRYGALAQGRPLPRRHYTTEKARYLCTDRTAAEPSPTAAATLLVDPERKSPMAKRPGWLVSNGNGSRLSVSQPPSS